MDVVDNQELGEKGEKIACNVLQQALSAHVLPPRRDVGLDGFVEFISAAPGRARLHFAIQIKTGFSYANDDGKRWRVRNLDREHFDRWRHSDIPVVFLWVNPDEKDRVYWHPISLDTDRDHFYISKNRFITPAARFDLAMRLEPWQTRSDASESDLYELYVPPLSSGMRSAAKEYYRGLMRKGPVTHPLLGGVSISWHAWRHITSQRRECRQIFESLRLLPILRWALAHPARCSGLRRLGRNETDKLVREKRLLVFRSYVSLSRRADATIEYVVRETIEYPVDWLGVPTARTARTAMLESIYERKEDGRSPISSPPAAVAATHPVLRTGFAGAKKRLQPRGSIR